MSDYVFKPQVPAAYAAAMKLAQSIHRFIKYGDECSTCGAPIEQMNPDCELHLPFEAEDVDAEEVVNSLIDEAREIMKQHEEWIEEQISPVAAAYRDAVTTSDGELEVDDGAIVSLGGDDGAYVASWTWVPDRDACVCSKCGEVKTEEELDDDYDTGGSICAACAKVVESGEKE